jgi:DNA processing protein
MALQIIHGAGDADDEDPASLAAWLRLVLTDDLSNTACRRLLSRFGLPGQVLRASQAALQELVPAHLARRIGARPVPALKARIDAALAWVAQPGHTILTLADAAYPSLLLSISDPPLLLYARGRIALLQAPAVAVVGSRNATRQGVEHAVRFSAELGRAGVTVVSGLALGIDAAAHAGALNEPGSTVAVIGTGIDIDYPAGNQVLASRIASAGCIVSEYALGAPPLAHHFPRRNRLISGLSRAVLVIEAAAQSGSLITARLAAEQGRDVFALPGSIHSPLAKGCHQLIREGAKLVETTRHILDELPQYLLPVAVPQADDCQTGNVVIDELDAGGDSTLVMQAIGHDPVDADTLAGRCQLDPARLAEVLLMLELEGRVEMLPGAHYRRLG